MSTRSCVIVKVKKDDINTTKRFDKDKLTLNVIKWEREEERRKTSLVEDVNIECQYIGIYCHWDGYKDGVGKCLADYIKTYESALNLVLGGYASSIYDGDVRYYANRKDEHWEYIVPLQNNDLESLVKEIGNAIVYIFDNDKWYYTELSNGKLEEQQELNFD